jgi:hypothetical protein
VRGRSHGSSRRRTPHERNGDTLSENSQVVGCITSNGPGVGSEMGPHRQYPGMHIPHSPHRGPGAQYSDSLATLRTSRWAALGSAATIAFAPNSSATAAAGAATAFPARGWTLHRYCPGPAGHRVRPAIGQLRVPGGSPGRTRAWPVCPKAAVRAMPSRLLLLCLLLRSSWLAAGGRPWSAPPECCIAGADGQLWPCRSAWLVAFRSSSVSPARSRCRDLLLDA